MAVVHNVGGIAGALRQAAAALPAARLAAMQACGVQILSWVWLQYRIKARGGSDIWGIRWKPIKPQTVYARIARLAKYKKAGKLAQAMMRAKAWKDHEIGVDTGRLVASLQFEGAGNRLAETPFSVMVGTQVEYAKWFDADRPIFPIRLTAGQVAELGEIVTEATEAVLADATKGAA